MKTSISLAYHDVFNESTAESGFQNLSAIKYKISSNYFEDHIKSIAIHCDKEHINKEKIILTFDDGGKSSITIIAPLLELNGFKGYFFIPTQFINHSGYLTDQDILELDHRGHFLGVHSHSHPPNISALDFGQIKYEWEQSIMILHNILNKNILYASVPNGYYSRDSLLILSENGVKVIFTSKPSTNYTIENGVKVIGRFPVTSGVKTKEILQFLTPYSIQRLKLLMKWHLLNIAKKILGKSYSKFQNLIIKIF